MTKSFPFNAINGEPAYSADDSSAFFDAVEPLLNGEANIFPLPVTMGGSGASDAAQARRSLGLAPEKHRHKANDATVGMLPVAHGGLGNIYGDGVFVKDGDVFRVADDRGTQLGILGSVDGSYGFFEISAYTADQMTSAFDRGRLVPSSSNQIAISGVVMPGFSELQAGVYFIQFNQFVQGRPYDGDAILTVIRFTGPNWGERGWLYEATRVSSPIEKHTATVIRRPSGSGGGAWVRIG